MWPTFSDGQPIEAIPPSSEWVPKVGEVVVVNHPLKYDMLIIKRISKIINEEKIFIEGDNPDPTCSEDSHNFGVLETNCVLGLVLS